MSEELASPSFSPMLNALKRPSLSRRQMLRAMTATSVAVVGGAVLAACGGEAQKPAADTPVTLTLGDWPIAPLPGSKAKTPREQATMDAISAWQKKHPNVKLEATSVKIDDAEKLRTAILGRRAPHIFPADRIGSLDVQRASYNLKLFADATDAYKKYQVDSLLADYAKPLWASKYALAGGKYFALPGDVVTVGNGLMYRRDVFEKAGIAEPDGATWTWEDFRDIAKKLTTYLKKPALGMPSYAIGYLLNSDRLDPDPLAGPGNGGLLGSVPNPGTGNTWHSKVIVTKWTKEWTDRVNLYRSMFSDDKTILQAAAYNEWTLTEQIASGQFAMASSVAIFYAIQAENLKKAAEKVGKTQDQAIGYITYPNGSNGLWNSVNEPNLGGVSFPGYVSSSVVDAAASLYLYMFYQDGYLDVRNETYKKTKLPASAFDYVAPANKYQKNPKLPADVTVESVYGKHAADTMNIVKRAVPPNPGIYFTKPETKTGPVQAPHDDLLSALSTGKGDVAAALKKYEDTYNQQVSTLPSDLSPSDFKASAEKYYQALDAFWKANAPKFAEGAWATYYNQYVTPALNG